MQIMSLILFNGIALFYFLIYIIIETFFLINLNVLLILLFLQVCIFY